MDKSGTKRDDLRTRLDLGHSDGRIYKLAQEGAREGAHSSLGRAVHASARVRFSSCDRANVDDVTRVAGFEV